MVSLVNMITLLKITVNVHDGTRNNQEQMFEAINSLDVCELRRLLKEVMAMSLAIDMNHKLN